MIIHGEFSGSRSFLWRDGISDLIYAIRPPLCFLLSFRYMLKESVWNCLSGKVSSILVSENARKSTMFSLNKCSTS